MSKSQFMGYASSLLKEIAPLLPKKSCESVQDTCDTIGTINTLLETLNKNVLEEKKAYMKATSQNILHEPPSTPPESFWACLGDCISSLQIKDQEQQPWWTLDKDLETDIIIFIRSITSLARNLTAGPVVENQSNASKHLMGKVISMTCTLLKSEKITDAHIPATDVSTQDTQSAIHMSMQMISNTCTGNHIIQALAWPNLFANTELLPLFFEMMPVSSYKYGLILILNSTQFLSDPVSAYENVLYPRRLLTKILEICDTHLESDDLFDLSYTILKNWLLLDTFNCLWTILDESPSELTVSRVRLLKILDGFEQNRDVTTIIKNHGLSTLECCLSIIMACTQEISRMITFDPTQALHSERISCTILLLQILTSALGRHIPCSVKENLVRKGMPVTLTALLKTMDTLSPPASTLKTENEAKESPLFMIKSDILHAIANVLYDCPLAQEEFRECGALPLLLSHCRIDDNNPLMREYALFAVRNILVNNPTNQDLVKGLEAKSIVKEEDIDRLGVQVELDDKGRLKFVGDKAG